MFLFIPRSRKSLVLFLSLLSAGFMIIAVFALVFWIQDQQILKENGQPDFNTLSQSDLKDRLIVKGTIDLALDFYAEEVKTNAGIDKSKSRYYLVPVYDEVENGYLFKYLITYEAEPEDYDTMDEIIANTWSDQAGLKKLTVENARIVTLPADNKKFFDEWVLTPELWGEGTFYDWCVETNIFGTNDRAVIESKLVPFMIDKTETTGTDPRFIWAFGGLSVIMLIILVIVLRRNKAKNAVNTPDGPDIMRPRQ